MWNNKQEGKGTKPFNIFFLDFTSYTVHLKVKSYFPCLQSREGQPCDVSICSHLWLSEAGWSNGDVIARWDSTNTELNKLIY